MSVLEVFYGGTALIGTVVGIFFVIRGIYRYQDWRAGEKKELYNFLAYWLAGAGALLIGIPMLQVFGKGENPFIAVSGPIGLILGLVAMALITYRIFLDWRELK